MTEPADLSFDIDALFEHMIKNLGHDIAQKKLWVFTLQSANLQTLKDIAGQLEGEFDVPIQEDVEVSGADGKLSTGDPCLYVQRCEAFEPQQVKEIAARMIAIAKQYDATYQGVSSFDPFDLNEFLGWLKPDDAAWRLRHWSDTGLEFNAEMPWVFFLRADDITKLNQIADALTAEGYDDFDVFDEPDEDGKVDLCMFTSGRNNEFDLNESCKKIASLAEQHGGQLGGVQFYNREQFEEVFFGDE